MKDFQSQRVWAVGAERVFQEIEDPARLALWWGPAGFTCQFHRFEFQTGGRWEFDMTGPDGKIYPNQSVFQKVDKPRQVVVRHEAEPPFTVTLTLEEKEGKTTLTWVQSFDDEATARALEAIITPANQQLLDKLQALVGQ